MHVSQVMCVYGQNNMTIVILGLDVKHSNIILLLSMIVHGLAAYSRIKKLQIFGIYDFYPYLCTNL